MQVFIGLEKLLQISRLISEAWLEGNFNQREALPLGRQAALYIDVF